MGKPKRRNIVIVIIIALLGSGLTLWQPLGWTGVRQSLVRIAAVQCNALQTREFLSLTGEHFVVKYLPVDEKYTEIILTGSEQAYDDVVQWFESDAPAQLELIVYPTPAALARSFGWERSRQSMGVYWGGCISIVSPAVWMEAPELDGFCREGPMVHELAHLMVDEVSGGNYTRWFTEGVAQYLEKQLNGFTFSTPETLTLLSLDELEQSFDGERQAIAYWQALQITEYIVAHYGEDSLRDIMAALRQGVRMNKALEQALGIDVLSFEVDCRLYIEQHFVEV